MNKEQFCEICSNFIALRMVNALAEQAEQKGYFDEDETSEVYKIRKSELLEILEVIEKLFSPFSDVIPDFERLQLKIKQFKNGLL